MAEAKKIGWTPDFLSSTASHTVNLPKLGGKDVEGFYTMALTKVPYADDDDPAVRDWVSSRGSGTIPTFMQSTVGRSAISSSRRRRRQDVI
jgi:hypothetical protein